MNTPTNTPDNNRFALIELDATPAPEPVTPEPTEADDLNEGRGVAVCEEGAARATEDEIAAKAAGFNPRPPLYTIGTKVVQWGVDNYRESRSQFEDMPTVVDACGRLIDQIKAEERKDHLVTLPSLHMNDDGTLKTEDNGTYPMSRRSLQGLCGFATPGGAGYLADCPPVLRAHNMNDWFERGYREDARATKKAEEAHKSDVEAATRLGGTMPDAPSPILTTKAVTLRTRNAEKGDRELFSVVGPRYGEHDIDKIAQQIIDGCPPDARCEVRYDGYRTRVDVLFHSNVMPEKVVAGEFFKAGVRLTTADDGSGSIKIAAQVWRNLCLNLIIIDHARELVASRRHFGKGIAGAVTEGIENALKKVEYFTDKWSEASVENILETFGVANMDLVLKALAFNKVVHVPGVSKKEMYARLTRAWQEEPGHSRTAVVNAVTRAAHEEKWRRWTDTEDLERVGGELLYAKRWNLDLTEAQAETLG